MGAPARRAPPGGAGGGSAHAQIALLPKKIAAFRPLGERVKSAQDRPGGRGVRAPWAGATPTREMPHAAPRRLRRPRPPPPPCAPRRGWPPPAADVAAEWACRPAVLRPGWARERPAPRGLCSQAGASSGDGSGALARRPRARWPRQAPMLRPAVAPGCVGGPSATVCAAWTVGGADPCCCVGLAAPSLGVWAARGAAPAPARAGEWPRAAACGSERRCPRTGRRPSPATLCA